MSTADTIAARLLALPRGPIAFRITRRVCGKSELCVVEHTPAAMPQLPRVFYAPVETLPPYGPDTYVSTSLPDDLAKFALEQLSGVMASPPTAPRAGFVSTEPGDHGNRALEADDATVMAAGAALLWQQIGQREKVVPLDEALDGIELFLRGDEIARPALGRMLALASAFDLPALVPAHARNWQNIRHTVLSAHGKWSNILSIREHERTAPLRAAADRVEAVKAALAVAAEKFDQAAHMASKGNATPAQIAAATEQLAAARKALSDAYDAQSAASTAVRMRRNKWNAPPPEAA